MSKQDKFKSIPVSVRMQESTLGHLEELKDTLEVNSQAEVIRRSVALMKLLADRIKDDGMHIVLEDDKGNKKELLISGLN
ncbi:ribbon-helix-helix protein, CopG family [Piscirickettsia litoralis]|uniref:Ribbon-helix-helix protein CopG domain-containing protein n=1 Tax=Piscirickettsia litoralis TaxID=1891921 RepID=A0ABX3A079_9GAMM|nr:ribbon-helix-helix protein, CopG family [Piscirickettsia litoralis]ODN41106.1 hypothetical protein BGC07_18345 [Piscirickettsia litoralis]